MVNKHDAWAGPFLEKQLASRHTVKVGGHDLRRRRQPQPLAPSNKRAPPARLSQTRPPPSAAFMLMIRGMLESNELRSSGQ